MNNVNQVTVCRDRYSSEEEFYEAMKTVIKFLINEGYILTVRNEYSPDIIVIEYDYADQKICEHFNCWLTAEEADLIDDVRASKLSDSES